MFNAIIEKYLPGYFCAKHFKGFIISCKDFLEHFILNELLKGVIFPIVSTCYNFLHLVAFHAFEKALLNDDCSIYLCKKY